MNEVVITGIGVISPGGKDKKEFWSNTEKGISFVEFDEEMEKMKISSSVNSKIHENVDTLIEGFKEVRNESRFTKLAVYAAEQALKDSKINDGNTERKDIGIISCSAIGGTPTIQKNI